MFFVLNVVSVNEFLKKFVVLCGVFGFFIGSFEKKIFFWVEGVCVILWVEYLFSRGVVRWLFKFVR